MSIVPPCPAGTCRSSVTTDGRYGWALSPFPQIRLSLCQMSRRQIWCCEQIAIIFISFFFSPLTFGCCLVCRESLRVVQ